MVHCKVGGAEAGASVLEVAALDIRTVCSQVDFRRNHERGGIVQAFHDPGSIFNSAKLRSGG